VEKPITIAIDGPAGSGKSTTAKLVAAKLGFQFLDTGAMYRALTYRALQNDVAPSDATTLTDMANRMQIRFETSDNGNRVFCDDAEVTTEIRTPEVTLHVSEVSAHPGVRKAMVAKQQEIAKGVSVVAEGRDTTTVVFPEAEVKVFLIATVEERAKRRLKDLEAAGHESSIDEQMADIERRDNYDSSREHSPLRKADDAVEIDTSTMTVEQQVDKILSLVGRLSDSR
jgi:cytidylate kinase